MIMTRARLVERLKSLQDLVGELLALEASSVTASKEDLEEVWDYARGDVESIDEYFAPK